VTVYESNGSHLVVAFRQVPEPAIEGEAAAEAQNQPENEAGNAADDDELLMQVDQRLRGIRVGVAEHRPIDMRRADDIGYHQEQQAQGLYADGRKRKDAKPDGHAKRGQQPPDLPMLERCARNITTKPASPHRLPWLQLILRLRANQARFIMASIMAAYPVLTRMLARKV